MMLFERSEGCNDGVGDMMGRLMLWLMSELAVAVVTTEVAEGWWCRPPAAIAVAAAVAVLLVLLSNSSCIMLGSTTLVEATIEGDVIVLPLRCMEDTSVLE